MGDQFDQFVLREPIFERPRKMERQLLRSIERNKGGDRGRLRSRFDRPGRCQTSPNNTSSVSSTNFGAISPIKSATPERSAIASFL